MLMNTQMIARHIIEDMRISLRFSDFSIYADSSYYEFVKNELLARFGLIKSYKTIFRKDVYDILGYNISLHHCNEIFSYEIDYIYLVIQCRCIFSETRFNYDVYDYCERRLQNKTNERRFQSICIRNVHDALCRNKNNNSEYNRILEEGEHRLIQGLFFKKQSEPNIFDFNRMKNSLYEVYKENVNSLSSYSKKNYDIYFNLILKEYEKKWVEMREN